MARLLSSRSAIAARVIEDQARHEMRHGLACLGGKEAPFRRSRASEACRYEQLQLSPFAPRIVMEARQPSHGHLSDSDRESPELPRKAEHSMMRLRRASPPAAAPSLRAAQLNRPAVSQQDGSQCTTPGRTSRLEVPASDPMRRRPGCSEPCRRLPSQSPHEYERRIQPTDANDTGLHVPQSCGRSGVALYNDERPHQALNMQRPAERYALYPTLPRSAGARLSVPRSRPPP